MPLLVGPSIPTESTTVVPAGGFSTWFKNIGDWLKLLSPSGATQYDTDWIATGLTVTAGTGWTVNSYRVRRVGKDVWVHVVATYGGANFTTIADGNMNDLTVATLPAGWRPIGGSWPVHVNEWAKRSWGGVVDLNGNVILTHGLPSQTATSGTTFYFNGNYLAD